MKKLLKDLIINLLPTAYVMVVFFLLTIFGMHMLSMSALNVVGVLVSIKIIFMEYALREVLYENNKKRVTTFVFNALLLLLGMTIFNLS